MDSNINEKIDDVDVRSQKIKAEVETTRDEWFAERSIKRKNIFQNVINWVMIFILFSISLAFILSLARWLTGKDGNLIPFISYDNGYEVVSTGMKALIGFVISHFIKIHSEK